MPAGISVFFSDSTRSSTARETATAFCPGFLVTLIVRAACSVPAALGPELTREYRRQSASATIEVEIAGAVVRIGDGAKTSTVAAVIRALKAPP